MSTQAVRAEALQLAAYDREAAYAILRGWSPQRLAAQLQTGQFGGRLTSAQRAELDELLTAWAQRALAKLPLRDALLVDERRGRRVYSLLCAELTMERVAVPPELASTVENGAVQLAELLPPLVQAPELAALAERAAARGLVLALQTRPDEFPYPENLEALLPTLPTSLSVSTPPFEQPTGWRRRIAAGLAAAGVLLLGVPLLVGRIPENPAGWPLALLTMALLVGIGARWPGYAGSLCIWLVANLPGFRHGMQLSFLLPALPLMGFGLILLGSDRRVRAMWRWLRSGLRR